MTYKVQLSVRVTREDGSIVASMALPPWPTTPETLRDDIATLVEPTVQAVGRAVMRAA